ncbi:hypothetical protein Psal071_03477 (plasmid) [Piscirickettsia salmonis]|uniref:Uncharacterized protein n=1 Tax=Piscirickettsia salmonis TaxID=1238 RepID=A0A9Q6LIQ5_PISSA|nr:hypothetical protein [Piscirickettsia salmonis]QGN96835.1 hypothetical protein Psal006a_03490 [Piscirickettsia salmonis]QGO04519.1 hypothetical protein Psal009_00388 [Piscirickettsia salmonis]QGO35911.1 hypothetical protein Psal028_03294 [Piscirickettsia salmonis]QGO39572.1 hypothetical protein Psal040_03345 [Piscirickettsia salmonis]QGO43143.1 hypothetical protein Psal041_03290 [Piscirickettsia salmonis]
MNMNSLLSVALQMTEGDWLIYYEKTFPTPNLDFCFTGCWFSNEPNHKIQRGNVVSGFAKITALLHSSKSDQFWRFAYPAATLTSN